MSDGIDISDLPAPPSSGPDISDLPAPPQAAAADTDDNLTAGLLTGTEPVVTTAREGALAVKGALKGAASIVTAPEAAVQWYNRHLYNAVASAAGAKPLEPEADAGDWVNSGLNATGFPTPQNKDEEAAELAGSTIGSNLAGLKGGSAVKGAPKQSTAELAQAAADTAASSGNAGAAGTAVDAALLHPDTQAELARIHQSGGEVNPTALTRHHEAETLPVPVPLTAGQATGDSALISREFNNKGQNNNAIGARYDQQDEALKENLTTLHRESSPLTVANNDIQNGQAVVDSLKRYDAPKVAEINDAYTAAKEANGGELQMDGSGFAAKAESNLAPQGKGRFLPSTVRGIIDDVKASGGQMSLDDFEGYRTALAGESRKAARAGDSNAVAAIGKVRDALEDTPPIGASAEAKALYDKARGLARDRFAEIEADPAYKAAVEDGTPVGEQSDIADKFADKYVLGGSKAALQRLRSKLDDEGGQAVTSSAMGYLQKKAGINPDTGAGKFSNAGYNSALTKITPKAQELLGDPALIENTRKLGNVANYTQAQSRGAFANNSHTFVAAATEAALEHGANIGAHGIPVGSAIKYGRRFLEGRAKAAEINESLKAGAGLAVR